MNKELYECHGHIMMDGNDYLLAKRRHKNGVDKAKVKEELKALSDAGVHYFRDGGDALGVSAYAKTIAKDYGIEYVTPLFAIHKKGYYGGIVGRGYSDMDEYRELVNTVKTEGGDFIKIMGSGIITFKEYGELSCPSLPEGEIRELIRIAHDAGFAVMIHINGDEAIRAAISAGADSIEHGSFMGEETARLLADSHTVWVPTAAAIAAFTKREATGGPVAEKTLSAHLSRIRFAADLGAAIACGSDSGAVGVPHGFGTAEEYRLLIFAGVSSKDIVEGNSQVRHRFL